MRVLLGGRAAPDVPQRRLLEEEPVRVRRVLLEQRGEARLQDLGEGGQRAVALLGEQLAGRGQPVHSGVLEGALGRTL